MKRTAKRIIALALCLMLCVALIHTATAAAASEADRIKQQITNTYNEAKSRSGRSSFNGMCGLYVNYQLVIRGINTSYIGADGNAEYDNYKNLSKSTGGFFISAYPASSYSLKNALNTITSNGSKDAYDILIGFEKGSGDDGALYGHTCFIHAILGGTVYFSESYSGTICGSYYSEGTPITASIDSFCSYYNSWTELDGVIHFKNPATAEYVNRCTYYPAYLTVKANESATVKTQPCSASTAAELGLTSEDVVTLSAGDTFNVTGMYKNTKDVYWYKGTTASGKSGYIFSGDYTITSYKGSIGYSGKAFPATLPQGKTYAVDWTIKADNLWLKNINGYIYSGSDFSTEKYHGSLTNVNASSKNLNGTDVDNKLLFDQLPTGTYKMVITATAINYYASGTDGKTLNSKTISGTPISFTFTIGSSQTDYVNDGDNFFAYIINLAPWKHIENIDNNVQVAGENHGIPKQIWHFIRQSDNSYKIINEYNGGLLTCASGTSTALNVLVDQNDTGAATQRWYLKVTGQARSLICKDNGKALDLADGSTSSGTNVQAYPSNDTDAQTFSLYKLTQDGKNYASPSTKLSTPTLSVNVSGNSAVFSWTSVATLNEWDSRRYELQIIGADGSVNKQLLEGTSYTATLTDGSYTAKICAVNKEYDYNIISYCKSDYSTKSFTIGSKPTITTQPSNVTATSGSTATFSVAASGSGTLTYQWYQLPNSSGTWTACANGTSSTFSVTASSSNSGYRYRCGVTNSAGTTYSSAATLTVTYYVSYNANGGTGAPGSQTKTHGVDLTLSSTKPTRANASAGSYTVTLNANGGSCDTTSLTAARTTKYTFKNWNTAANGSGTSYSAGATYSNNASATLYAQWNSSTSTAAVTLPTPTWTGHTFKGWATSSTATSGSTGSYTPSGNVTLYAIWEQDTQPPVIITQPEDITVAAGKTATFTVVAEGTGLSYQWYVQLKGSEGWDPISSATKDTLSFTADSVQNGRRYRCEVSNDKGTVSSEEAKLTVVTKPKITTQPKAASVKAGKKVTFKVKATGGALKYQWYYQKKGTTKWVKISKATKATYSFTVKKSQNGYKYRCTVTNAAGKVNSKAVKLTVK